MKLSSVVLKVKYLIALLTFTFLQTLLWAQAETTESSSSTTKVTISEETATDWYTNPIVWVIGGAIFILLLVALLRGGGSNRTATHTYKEKVVRESDNDTGRV